MSWVLSKRTATNVLFFAFRMTSQTSLSLCTACGHGCAQNGEVHIIGGLLYHRSCVRCSVCCRQLASGDTCARRSCHQLVCEDHMNSTRKELSLSSKETIGVSRSKRQGWEGEEEMCEASDVATRDEWTPSVSSTDVGVGTSPSSDRTEDRERESAMISRSYGTFTICC